MQKAGTIGKWSGKLKGVKKVKEVRTYFFNLFNPFPFNYFNPFNFLNPITLPPKSRAPVYLSWFQDI
jgi:hypothetical protein